MALPRQTIIPLIIACSLFMEHLDSSIIATALPVIAQSLGTDPLRLNLAITAYLFSLAVFIPLSGWAADRFGARTVFRAAILLFTASSAACGLAETLTQLVLARLVQGFGGAMMVPVGRLVLLRCIPKEELLTAMAWFTAPALLGPVLGPPLGGWIVTYWSWRWIFFINLPVGILGIVLATRYIDDLREEKVPPLDLRGFILMALALGGLVFGLETTGRHLVPLRDVLALLGGGAVCFALYLWHAKGRAFPIVDFNLLKIQTFRACTIGGSAFRVGVGAMPLLLPLLFQVGFGLTPLASGLLTFSSAAGAVFMKLVAKPLLRRFGFRAILLHVTWIGNLLLVACAYFTAATPHWLIVTILFVGGFARSIQFTALNTLAFADLPDEAMSRGTTLVTTMQQLSLSLGVAIGALVLNVTLAGRPSEFLHPHDFLPAFWVVALISTSSALWFFRLPEKAGSQISGGGGVPPRA